MKKGNRNPVDAEFRMDDEDRPLRRAAGARPGNKRKSSRGGWVKTLFIILPIWALKQAFSVGDAIGVLVGEALRLAVVPLSRGVAALSVGICLCLGVIHFGAYAIRGSVAEARSLMDRVHGTVNGSADALLAMVPSLSGHTPPAESLPKALPVLASHSPQAEGSGMPSLLQPVEPPSVVDAVSDAAAGAVNLLLPSLTDYPKPTDSLPPIEGDILELAGGHRMQLLITSILPAIEHVESSGRQELIGDNGLAYGPLQVRREPCEDLKDRFGIKVNPADCNGNYALSEYVVRLYLGYWGSQHELRTGKVATAKDLCRTWNGGPDQGPFNKTDAYWARCTSHDDSIAYLAAE